MTIQGPRNGLLITLEGPEGCGKTSSAMALAQYLRSIGLDVVDIREPGGCDISEQIREVLTRIGNVEITTKTEALLFQAARAQITGQVIRPALNEGKIVVCDRFRDSSVVIQGHVRELGCGRIDRLCDYATGGLEPDLTLLLDVDIETGLQRKEDQGQWNRLDGLDPELHRKVRMAFLTLCSCDESDRWRLIDASQPQETVIGQIIDITHEKLLECGIIEGGIRRECGI